jgi:hypothetical protein
MALGLELAPQRLVVVDLAVLDDPDRPVLVGHRLVPGRREVDDRQASVAETHSVLGEDQCARVVGPSVDERTAHRTDNGLFHGQAVTEGEQSGDATHL